MATIRPSRCSLLLLCAAACGAEVDAPEPPRDSETDACAGVEQDGPPTSGIHNDCPGYPDDPCRNDRPVAGFVAVTTPRDAPVTFVLPGCDPDSEVAYLADHPPPGHGRIKWHAATGRPSDPTVTYTPNHGYCGADRFDYAVSDGRSAQGRVRVEVVCL